MLVLSRKIGESVIVTGLPGRARELKVTIIGLERGQIQLGFESHPGTAVLESEASINEFATAGVAKELQLQD